MAYIAVDFDGTCVTHDFPRVGKDIGAVPVLKELVKNGHRLILYTMRSHGDPRIQKNLPPTYVGKLLETDVLDDAIQWFKDNDIPLFAVNDNPTQHSWTNSKKVYFHVLIDDAALGVPLKKDIFLSKNPYVDWKEVRKELVRMGYIE